MIGYTPTPERDDLMPVGKAVRGTVVVSKLHRYLT